MRLACSAVALACACTASVDAPRSCLSSADLVDPCGAGRDGGVGALPGTPDPGAFPAGTVGADGGSVERLWFATTGDTRPALCNDTAAYPKEAIAQIAAAMKSLRVQFALDLGDHMYVCSDQGGLSPAQLDATARAQMGLYQEAVAQGPSTWWMTMGNHECDAAYNQRLPCSAGGAHDPNFAAYLAALRRPQPYYFADVRTALGLARFVVVADDAWDDAQSAWLSSALTEADAKAKYTIVARHHPVTGTRTGPAEILSILKQHRYSLVLTAHNHDYEHDTEAWGGRSAVVGLGGAGGLWGFATVSQEPDGTLQVVRRDANGNPLGDSWSVTPQ